MRRGRKGRDSGQNAQQSSLPRLLISTDVRINDQLRIAAEALVEEEIVDALRIELRRFERCCAKSQPYDIIIDK